MASKTHALWIGVLLLLAVAGCRDASAPTHSPVVRAKVAWHRADVDEPVTVEIADPETLDKLLACLVGFDSSDETARKLDKSVLDGRTNQATVEFFRADETKTLVFAGSNSWNVVGVQHDLPLEPKFYELLRSLVRP
jgi:hypothetical protein